MRPVSFLLAAILCLTLATPADSKSNPLHSIRPFQVIATNNETGKEFFDDICTAWATVVDGHYYWVTAMHCVGVDSDGMPNTKTQYYVDEKPVYLKLANFNTDIAMLTGGPVVTPLPVAFSAPKVGQKVWSAGYPMDEGLVEAVGVVMSLDLKVHHLVFYQLPAGPGVSGGPILSEDNTVVGILQMMGCPYIVGYCPVSMGVPLDQLRLTLDTERKTVN